MDKKHIPDVDPQFVMDWAFENKREFDVFVFLGTNKMNLKDFRKAKKEYQELSKKSIKYAIFNIKYNYNKLLINLWRLQYLNQGNLGLCKDQIKY